MTELRATEHETEPRATEHLTELRATVDGLGENGAGGGVVD